MGQQVHLLQVVLLVFQPILVNLVVLDRRGEQELADDRQADGRALEPERLQVSAGGLSGRRAAGSKRPAASRQGAGKVGARRRLESRDGPRRAAPPCQPSARSSPDGWSTPPPRACPSPRRAAGMTANRAALPPACGSQATACSARRSTARGRRRAAAPPAPPPTRSPPPACRRSAPRGTCGQMRTVDRHAYQFGNVCPVVHVVVEAAEGAHAMVDVPIKAEASKARAR